MRGEYLCCCNMCAVNLAILSAWDLMNTQNKGNYGYNIHEEYHFTHVQFVNYVHTEIQTWYNSKNYKFQDGINMFTSKNWGNI